MCQITQSLRSQIYKVKICHSNRIHWTASNFFFLVRIEAKNAIHIFDYSNLSTSCLLSSANIIADKKNLNPVKGLLHSIKKRSFSVFTDFLLFIFWGANNKSKWIAALKIYSTEKYIRFHYMVLCIYSEIWIYSFRSFKYLTFIYSTSSVRWRGTVKGNKEKNNFFFLF